MKLFRATLLAAAPGCGSVLVAAAAARAEPVAGFYVGAGAGYNLLQDVTATVDAVPGRSGAPGVSANAPMKVTWGGGYSLSGAIGWGFGNGLRLELEGSFRSNPQTGGPSGDGRQTQFGVMGNALYDVDVGPGWMSPYFGMGAGYQAASWSRVAGQVSGIGTGSGPSTISVDQTLGGFAYQVIVGVAFPIRSVPGLAVTAEYRYLDVTGNRAYHAAASAAGGSDAATRVHAPSDASHSVMIGLRYAFDAPETAPVERPPPAPEAAMPAPAQAAPIPRRTYLVFFDWDSAELTPRARDVIDEAVRNSARAADTRIEVTGHADRTGPARANQSLSLRRAQVVAAELERHGLPPTAIEIHAAGETKLLVPTAPGVRQPENRRVEIVYR